MQNKSSRKVNANMLLDKYKNRYFFFNTLSDLNILINALYAKGEPKENIINFVILAHIRKEFVEYVGRK
jgi:hypothetical protein